MLFYTQMIEPLVHQLHKLKLETILNVCKMSKSVNYYRGENTITWTNKQIGDAKICSRINRAFGNYEWMMKWRHI